MPKKGLLLYDIETVQYMSQKLWQMLPASARKSPSLMAFKQEFKSCIVKCDCRVRKIFISMIGFI